MSVDTEPVTNRAKLSPRDLLHEALIRGDCVQIQAALQPFDPSTRLVLVMGEYDGPERNIITEIVREGNKFLENNPVISENYYEDLVQAAINFIQTFQATHPTP